jgi:hypothetical protein
MNFFRTLENPFKKTGPGLNSSKSRVHYDYICTNATLLTLPVLRIPTYVDFCKLMTVTLNSPLTVAFANPFPEVEPRSILVKCKQNL